MNSEQIKGCARILVEIEGFLRKRVEAENAESVCTVSGLVPTATFAGGRNAIEHEAIEALRNIIDVWVENEVARLRQLAKECGHEITDDDVGAMEARLSERTHNFGRGGTSSTVRQNHVCRLSPEEQDAALAKYPDHTPHKAMSLYAIDKTRAPQLSVVGN